MPEIGRNLGFGLCSRCQHCCAHPDCTVAAVGMIWATKIWLVIFRPESPEQFWDLPVDSFFGFRGDFARDFITVLFCVSIFLCQRPFGNSSIVAVLVCCVFAFVWHFVPYDFAICSGIGESTSLPFESWDVLQPVGQRSKNLTSKMRSDNPRLITK